MYCLRLSDGALIWRFHAAPARRLVVAHGNLESAWPLNGSVLIRDGKVYAVAGRSSFLDGGLVAYCLDALTGKVLDKHQIAHQQDMTVDTGRYQNDDTGVYLDLLVSEGNSVYMRHIRVFGTDRPKVGWGQRVGATAGMLDDSWFNRTLWLVDGRDHGELLVHDGQTVYAVRVHKSRGHGQYIEPGTDAYQVVATDRKSASARRAAGTAAGQEVATSQEKPVVALCSRACHGDGRWRQHVALCGHAGHARFWRSLGGL